MGIRRGKETMFGRRFYYDKLTGQVIIDTGQAWGVTEPPSVEDDITRYLGLQNRARESWDYLDIEYGAYSEDFLSCSSFKIDPDSKEILFSYPDPSEPTEPTVYQKPLSVQVAETNRRLSDVELALADIIGI